MNVLRELAAEDDCGWLDVARFPDVSMVDLADICRYRDPLQFFDPFGDPARVGNTLASFNEEKVYRADADTVYRVIVLPRNETKSGIFFNVKTNGYENK